MTVLVKSVIITDPYIAIIFGSDRWYSPISTSFVYVSTGYELATLAAVFLFGWLLERRHGHWVPLFVYAAGTAVGIALALLTDHNAVILGGNAGALALLGAWVVRDLLSVRAGNEIESDLLGVAGIAVLLALLPAAVHDADPIAGAGGALTGLVLGLPLARMRER
jgi:membrane associated rhomboid family serine protease